MSDLGPLLHPDPLVRQVFETWTPRYLAGGIALGEMADIAERIDTWDDWNAEWMAAGAEHEVRAEAAEQAGHLDTAAQAWLQASKCYHIGYHVATRDPQLHDDGLQKMLDCHERARPRLRPAIDRFEIGDGAERIVGLISIPAQQPAPVVIFLPGLDSTKETRHGARAKWMARGFAVISIDGPGQGEASRWSVIRPDYDVAVSAVIDWIEAHDALDASRIGLVGASLGGYYAPRAAAFEPRLGATVGNCGPYDWAACLDIVPRVTFEAYVHYSGADSEAEARELANAMTLEGVAERITSPLLIVHGKDDPLIPWQHGQRIVDEASGPAEFVLVEGGNHGVNNLPHRSGPVIIDWVCDQLGIPT